MQILRPFLVLLAVSLLMIPAQAKGGDPISPDNNTLWAQYTTDPECCTLWMGTVQNDPDFEGSGNYGYRNMVGSSVHWEYPLVPKPDYNITLDGGGTVDFTVYIGGLANPFNPTVGAGQVDVSTELLAGSTVVAAGEAKSINLIPGSPFQKLTWSVTPAVTELTSGLLWRITASGTTDGVYISHQADGAGHTNLVLPVLAVTESEGPPTEEPASEEPEPTEPGEPQGEESPTPTSEPTAEATSGPAEEPEKDTPWPFPLVLLTLVAVARRRL